MIKSLEGGGRQRSGQKLFAFSKKYQIRDGDRAEDQVRVLESRINGTDSLRRYGKRKAKKKVFPHVSKRLPVKTTEVPAGGR